MAGQAVESQPGRTDRLPDVHVRVAEHQHVITGAAAPDLVGDPRLLAARHEMINQYAEPPPALGGEVGHDRRQVIDAAEVLHHHADVTEVVAPDPLDQLGVVPALDVDPAGQGGPGPGGRAGDRSGGGPGGCRGRARTGALSSTGRPSYSRPAPNGKLRRLPCRSSSTTRPFSQRSTAPQKPVVASSRTCPSTTISSVLTGRRGALPVGLQDIAAVTVAGEAHRGSVGRRCCRAAGICGRARWRSVVGWAHGCAADVPARVGAVPPHAAAAAGLRGALSDHARRPAEGRGGQLRRRADRARSRGRGRRATVLGRHRRRDHPARGPGGLRRAGRPGRPAVRGASAGSTTRRTRGRRSATCPTWSGTRRMPTCAPRPSGWSGGRWPWPASSPRTSGPPTPCWPTIRWPRPGNWPPSRRSARWIRSVCCAPPRSPNCSPGSAS